MADSDRQGTEAPTQRRRDEARRDGQVVQSPDLGAAVALFTGLLTLMWFSGPLGRRLLADIRMWFHDVPRSDWTTDHALLGARWMSSELLATCAVFTGLLLLTGLLIGFLQVGFVVTWKPLAPDWERLAPTRGLQRLMSLESAVRGSLGIMKVGGLLIVSGILVWLRRDEFSAANFGSLSEILLFGWNFGLTVGIALAGVILVLAAIDYGVRWFRHEQKLKMTHEEIKREQKDDLGDPTLKIAMRRRAREAIRNGSVSEVPGATMVITNPTRLAVALRYDQETMKAPRVVAKGAGIFAKHIRETARRHNVPVMEHKPLARALFRTVRVGQEIPAEFFRAVAELMAQVLKMRRRAA